MELTKRNLLGFPQLSNFFNDDWFDMKPFKQSVPAAINVVDNKNNYEVEVVAPGLKKEDFNISIENGVLCISGKTESEQEEKDKNYVRKEYSASSFSRSFTLPDNTDEDSIAANYNDGILKLTINKTEVENAVKKEIDIK